MGMSEPPGKISHSQLRVTLDVSLKRFMFMYMQKDALILENKRAGRALKSCCIYSEKVC